jgi:hypothetical protein
MQDAAAAENRGGEQEFETTTHSTTSFFMPVLNSDSRSIGSGDIE